jgi:hypothetical protein
LLNIIDHLPPNTHTNAAISQDEEHVKLMIEAGLKPAKGVSSVYYGSVEQRLDTAIDAMNRVGDLIVATNAKRGRRTPPTKHQPRPKTAFSKVQHEARLARHQALTARVLPNGPMEAPDRPRVAGQRRRDRRVLDGTAVVAQQGTATLGKVDATREGDRQARWAARGREVGRVTPSSEPATEA